VYGARTYWLDDSSPPLPEGRPVFVSGSVRTDETSEGLPILDVGGWIFPSGGADDEERFLPVDSVLDFCRLTVDGDLLSRGEWSGMAEVLPWVRSSDQAWTRRPVSLYLEMYARELELGRARALPLGVAGTWAAEVETPSGDSVQFFFRTASHAREPWTGPRGDARRPVPGTPWAFRAAGVQFRIWTALELEHLPGPSGEPELRCETGPWLSTELPPTDPNCGTGYASVIVEPLRDDLEAWQGLFPVNTLALLDDDLKELDRPEGEGDFLLRLLRSPPQGQDFWVFDGDDSRSAFVQRVRLRNGEVILTARRISPTAVAGN
jgi:hypothetical protein